MELTRSGAHRFHGWKKLFGKTSKTPKLSWDSENCQVVLEVSRVDDGLNTFDYRLSLNLQEVAQMIDLIASNGIAKSVNQVAEGFTNSHRSLTRLSVVASGLAVAAPAVAGSSKGAA